MLGRSCSYCGWAGSAHGADCQVMRKHCLDPVWPIQPVFDGLYCWRTLPVSLHLYWGEDCRLMVVPARNQGHWGLSWHHTGSCCFPSAIQSALLRRERKITEWPWSEGTSWSNLVQQPCWSRATCPEPCPDVFWKVPRMETSNRYMYVT